MSVEAKPAKVIGYPLPDDTPPIGAMPTQAFCSS